MGGLVLEFVVFTAPLCGLVGAVLGGLIAAILNWVGNHR